MVFEGDVRVVCEGGVRDVEQPSHTNTHTHTQCMLGSKFVS